MTSLSLVSRYLPHFSLGWAGPLYLTTSNETVRQSFALSLLIQIFKLAVIIPPVHTVHSDKNVFWSLAEASTRLRPSGLAISCKNLFSSCPLSLSIRNNGKGLKVIEFTMAGWAKMYWTHTAVCFLFPADKSHWSVWLTTSMLRRCHGNWSLNPYWAVLSFFSLKRKVALGEAAGAHLRRTWLLWLVTKVK